MTLITIHIATLCKYAGISFIAGAVNHGFFSEERSLLTAGVGVLAYLLGGVLEMRQLPASERRWLDLLGFGVVSSIGLGFFTGGLQHFPDSPARSAWVVPLGFAMSLLAFWISQRRGATETDTPALGASERRSLAVYGGVAGILLTFACITAWQWFEREGGAAGHDHALHSHEPTPAVASASPTQAASEPTPPPGSAGTVQEVRIEMFDTMRFSPDQISIRAGEPVKLTVVNRGSVRHELMIGTKNELAEHAREMKSSKNHHHHDNATSLEPGQSITVSRVFAEAGELGMACFEPGHYEAGMRGSIRIEPRS